MPLNSAGVVLETGSGAGSAREVEEATAALQQTRAAEERDLAAIAVLGGATILRVHDVAATVDAVRVARATRASRQMGFRTTTSGRIVN